MSGVRVAEIVPAWYTVFIENLVVVQLVKKVPIF
jgi:hypothetical protein